MQEQNEPHVWVLINETPDTLTEAMSCGKGVLVRDTVYEPTGVGNQRRVVAANVVYVKDTQIVSLPPKTIPMGENPVFFNVLESILPNK